MSYHPATGLRCFTLALGAVFASGPEEAGQFASAHGLWDRRPVALGLRGHPGARLALCGPTDRIPQEAR